MSLTDGERDRVGANTEVQIRRRAHLAAGPRHLDNVAALDAQATIGEITGALREGQGVHADPFVSNGGGRR